MLRDGIGARNSSKKIEAEDQNQPPRLTETRTSPASTSDPPVMPVDAPAGNTVQRLKACDMCGRETPETSLCRVDGTICLCQSCWRHLEKIPAGIVKDSLLRFLNGNVI